MEVIELTDANFIRKLKEAVNSSYTIPSIVKKRNKTCLKLIKGNSQDENIYDKILYIFEQYKKNNGCEIRCKLSNNCVKHLRSFLSKPLEYTGTFYLGKRVNKVFIVHIKTNTIENGELENVQVSPTRINFHSHPKKAYEANNVKKAWPSVTDYLGYLKLGNRTVFHCVSTLEGIYIMSFGKYWVEHLNNVSTEFVEKNYEVSRETSLTPTQYVDKVNKILYLNYPIFQVNYLPWESAETIFTVRYQANNQLCKLY